jgi:hypothetical protein
MDGKVMDVAKDRKKKYRCKDGCKGCKGATKEEGV